MVKKITVNCEICEKKISVEIDPSIVKEKDYFPFEYIHIHGKPEHAVMLFIDKNLVCRDTVVYRDLAIAKKQKEEFKSLVRMSELDTLMSIYSDPIRLRVFDLLRREPMLEEDLIEALKEDPSFAEQNFNMLMLPFEKTGIVKSSWLSDSFSECYFIVRDFVAMRVPSDIAINNVTAAIQDYEFYNQYVESITEMFSNYRKRFMSSEANRVKEILDCFNILKDQKKMAAIKSLQARPKELKELKGVATKSYLNSLIRDGLVTELKYKKRAFYALMCDVKVRIFAPRYIVSNLINGLKEKSISRDIAMKHFNLLYEVDAK